VTEEASRALELKMERLSTTQDHMASAVRDMAASVGKLADKLDASDDIAKMALAFSKEHERRIKTMEDRSWAIVSAIVLLTIGTVWKLVTG
jgi:hypothetical protein